MTETEWASKNRLRAMKFTKHFPGSATGVLRIAAASDRFPTIDFCCSDPQPPFEDIVNWIKQSCAIWSARFGQTAASSQSPKKAAVNSGTFAPMSSQSVYVTLRKDSHRRIKLFNLHSNWQPTSQTYPLEKRRRTHI